MLALGDNVTAMSQHSWCTRNSPQRSSCDTMAICFVDDLTVLVLSMFKTWCRWHRPRWSHCDLQQCHSALWDFTMIQQQSRRFFQMAVRLPSCVTGVLLQTYACFHLTNCQKSFTYEPLWPTDGPKILEIRSWWCLSVIWEIWRSIAA